MIAQDVTVLHLAQPLTYNQYIQPAVLPEPGEQYTGITFSYKIMLHYAMHPLLSYNYAMQYTSKKPAPRISFL